MFDSKSGRAKGGPKPEGPKMQYSHKFLWNKSAGVYTTALGRLTGVWAYYVQTAVVHLAKTAVGEIYICNKNPPSASNGGGTVTAAGTVAAAADMTDTAAAAGVTS